MWKDDERKSCLVMEVGKRAISGKAENSQHLSIPDILFQAMAPKTLEIE